jgi:antitoxin VapB
MKARRSMPTWLYSSQPDKVKLFRHNRRQAVRIPSEFALPGDRVPIHRDGDKLIIEPLARIFNIVSKI